MESPESFLKLSHLCPPGNFKTKFFKVVSMDYSNTFQVIQETGESKVKKFWGFLILGNLRVSASFKQFLIKESVYDEKLILDVGCRGSTSPSLNTCTIR